MVFGKVATGVLGLLAVGGVGSTAYVAASDPKDFVAIFTGEKTYEFSTKDNSVSLSCSQGKYPNIGVMKNGEVVILCQGKKQLDSFTGYSTRGTGPVKCEWRWNLVSGRYECNFEKQESQSVTLKNTTVSFNDQQVSAIVLV
ncbi:hypothetical protein MHLP_03005 [Candidatus Mycoplasma haematolamae str. Purdue]|uniref:Uncharacterized protein n=1 Tax=Mycoplasma haematolamae (strain Purdue) TaxID=1212765 RepID=I7CG22_MYCHA|nr:hypothetical protein MHLP_03005 [Candidatus Mycoplasma haematolamae str. Purdue]